MNDLEKQVFLDYINNINIDSQKYLGDKHKLTVSLIDKINNEIASGKSIVDIKTENQFVIDMVLANIDNVRSHTSKKVSAYSTRNKSEIIRWVSLSLVLLCMGLFVVWGIKRHRKLNEDYNIAVEYMERTNPGKPFER